MTALSWTLKTLKREIRADICDQILMNQMREELSHSGKIIPYPSARCQQVVGY
jgi:hypothetical protein